MKYVVLFPAAAATFLLVWCTAAIAVRVTGVPRDFPPFTALPLLTGVAGGYIGAVGVYVLIAALSNQPNRTFFFVSLAVLALSFGLPLRLSYTHSPRFAGVTPAAQMSLALLQTLIAACIVTALTRAANPAP